MLNTTRIIIRVNDNAATYEKPASNDDFEEEKLVNTIFKYF